MTEAMRGAEKLLNEMDNPEIRIAKKGREEAGRVTPHATRV